MSFVFRRGRQRCIRRTVAIEFCPVLQPPRIPIQLFLHLRQLRAIARRPRLNRRVRRRLLRPRPRRAQLHARHQT